MRYRKPSLKTALGVTKAKKKINKAVGLNKVNSVKNYESNAKRKVKRKLGYETEPMKLFRFINRLMK